MVRSGEFELFYEYADYENLREHEETDLLMRKLPQRYYSISIITTYDIFGEENVFNEEGIL